MCVSEMFLHLVVMNASKADAVVDIAIQITWVRCLARGGYGTVELYQTNTGLHFVRKSIRGDSESTEQSVRLRNEIELLLALRCSSIVPIVSYCIDPQSLWYIMPYFSNGNLKEFVTAPPSLSRALAHYNQQHALLIHDWCFDLLNGLEAAHQAGVIHRDLKPENILVSDQFKLLIADWGLVYRNDGHLTAPLGTQHYAAPELLAGLMPSIRSDIFALGRVLEFFLRLLDYRPGSCAYLVQERLIPLLTHQDPTKRPDSCRAVLFELTRLEQHARNAAQPYLLDGMCRPQ